MWSDKECSFPCLYDDHMTKMIVTTKVVMTTICSVAIEHVREFSEMQSACYRIILSHGRMCCRLLDEESDGDGVSPDDTKATDRIASFGCVCITENVCARAKS